MIKSRRLRWEGHVARMEKCKSAFKMVTRGTPTEKRPLGISMIKSRRLRWGGHVARMKEGRSAFKVLTGTLAGKRPLGRPRRRWEDNIRMDLKQIGINTRNWFIRLRVGIIGEPL